MNAALKTLIRDLDGREHPEQLAEIIEGWDRYFRRYEIESWNQEREFLIHFNMRLDRDDLLVAPDVAEVGL
jgi:hypothetical protein